MRLWNIDLIENNLLPKLQLLAQWRELNSIFKKQDKHILINYIYNYSKDYLYCYTQAVIQEMCKRKIKIKSLDNYNNYFAKDVNFYWNVLYDEPNLRFKEHNDTYLLVCFMNLCEKYVRGQKDFTKECFNKLYDYVNTKFDLKSLGINKD